MFFFIILFIILIICSSCKSNHVVYNNSSGDVVKSNSGNVHSGQNIIISQMKPPLDNHGGQNMNFSQMKPPLNNLNILTPPIDSVETAGKVDIVDKSTQREI